MENTQIQLLQENQYQTDWGTVVNLDIMSKIFEFILSDEFLPINELLTEEILPI